MRANEFINENNNQLDESVLSNVIGTLATPFKYVGSKIGWDKLFKATEKAIEAGDPAIEEAAKKAAGNPYLLKLAEKPAKSAFGIVGAGGAAAVGTDVYLSFIRPALVKASEYNIPLIALIGILLYGGFGLINTIISKYGDDTGDKKVAANPE